MFLLPGNPDSINVIISFGICSTPKESKYVTALLFTYNTTQ